MGFPRLVLRTPGRRALTLVLDHDLELGREADGVMLADSKVSRRHVVLAPTSPSTVRVTDLGSSNGTFVGDTRIAAPTIVEAGTIVRLGDTLVEIVAGDDASATVRRTQLVGPQVGRRTSIEAVASEVSTSAVDAELIGVADDPGTLTVVFSDIESSVELTAAMGDTRWFELLRHHAELVTAHVTAHRGRIVKHQGDGYMLCFHSARQALLCSIGLQRDLERTARDRPDLAVRVRIGMHTGEVLVDDDGQLFGRHVNMAARIGGAAQGTEILVSSLVKAIAEPRGDIVFGDALELELKGIEGLTVAHAVDWRSSPVVARR